MCAVFYTYKNAPTHPYPHCFLSQLVFDFSVYSYDCCFIVSVLVVVRVVAVVAIVVVCASVVIILVVYFFRAFFMPLLSLHPPTLTPIPTHCYCHQKLHQNTQHTTKLPFIRLSLHLFIRPWWQPTLATN